MPFKASNIYFFGLSFKGAPFHQIRDQPQIQLFVVRQVVSDVRSIEASLEKSLRREAGRPSAAVQMFTL